VSAARLGPARRTFRPLLSIAGFCAPATATPSHTCWPAIRGWIADGGCCFASAAAHLDFGAVRSPPWDDWVLQNGVNGTKTVLQEHSYYYAHGASVTAQATLEYMEPAGVRSNFGHHDPSRIRSGAGHGGADVHNTDEVLEGAVWIGHTTPERPFTSVCPPTRPTASAR
jgi:hypothetical protein